MDAQRLTATTVETIFRACLFSDDEDTSDHAVARGIVTNVGFHPGRLAEQRAVVATLLRELPAEFMADGGGGWSFLNACLDRNGEQWTGDHGVMERLFLLGLALGMVQEQLPREMWSVLPGGMPYYVVATDPEPTDA